ncbi:MAG: acetate--CoA ligase family protein [Acidimicrobiia bacterium]|nr:acetate--CoA ligase family protein [Acidimicrobiia bacterium]MCY4432664.1 acetate--CoA ligase family protein [bacterium]
MTVPEPEVKALLAAVGVAVPKGVVAAYADTVANPSMLADLVAAHGMDEPLVLKGFGGSVVHKSDVGAVRLGVAAYELNYEAAQMAVAVTEAGGRLGGFLVEEQADAGVELLVGVVDRPPFGPVAALGLGGTLTEVLDEVVLRLAPISRADAEAMVIGFKGSELLTGFRGQPPVDIDALIELLLAVAGPGGLAAEIGENLAELECNPVIATPDGAIAVDARLITREAPIGAHPERPITDFGPLFAPRGIAVAGASTSRPGFGNTFLTAYKELGWGPGTLWAVHPKASEVDGIPAVPSVADIDGEVDYVVGAVPAAACADLVRGAAGKAQFVHVISGGFREASAEGANLEDELANAARQSGVRVLGPNCLGAYSPAGRQTFLRNAPTEAGRVSMISQSGGLAGDMVKAGAIRGIRLSKLCTVGNSIDVTPGELLEWLVDDADTAIIGMYLEDPRDGRRLTDALHAAKGRKPVVILVGGRTAQGRGAAVSHTGALVADHRIWDAISASAGVSIVGTIEELLSAVAYLQRWADADIGGELDTLVLGVGGGASVLGTDAADRAGLVTTTVSDQGQQALKDLGYGVGASVRNPIEIGFGPVSEPDVLVQALDPILQTQPYPDVVVHTNVQAFFSYAGDGIERLFPIIETTAAATTQWPHTRLSLVLRNIDCAPPDIAARIQQTCLDANLPTFTRFTEAMTAVAAAKRHARNRALSR